MINKNKNTESQFNQNLLVVFKDILPAFTKAGIKYWVFGGVGVAGILGKFIRENEDVDVYVLNEDFARVENLLKVLCEVHGSWVGDGWSLSYSVLKNTKRWKLDIYIKKEKKFSVIPISKTISGTEIRFAEVYYLSDKTLIQESRIIDGFEFFSPPRDVIIQLFRILTDRYLQQYNKKSADDISKVIVDAQAIYSKEEFAELIVKFKKKAELIASQNAVNLDNVPGKIKNKFNNLIIFILKKISDKITPHLKVDSHGPARLQTFEQYLIINHKQSGLELINEKIRLIGLKLLGVKNHKKFLKLINYFEENGCNSVSKFMVLNEAIFTEKTNIWKAQNLETRMMEFFNTSDKAILGRNKTPFHFNMELAKPAAELFNLSTNPKKMLELLHLINYWPQKYDLDDNFQLDSSRGVSYQVIQDLSHEDLSSLFEQYQYVPMIQDFIIKNSSKIVSLPSTKVKIYLEIFNKINDLSIMEIKRLQIPLITQLLESDHPYEDYQKIEKIFIENDTPLIGKIYDIFEILYGSNSVVYQDLLKIHIQSANYSLKEYIERLEKNGQKMFDTIYEKYIEPAGLNNLTQLLEKINLAKIFADERSREIIFSTKKNSPNGAAILEIGSDNFIRAINIQYFDNILKNGCVAKEFLGENYNFNDLPFNINVSRVKPDYGEILLVLKDSGQYHITNFEQYYELRTGFPSTDIHFIIVRDRIILSQPIQLEQIFIKIAQIGFYLPVTNESGEVIFTPEMYDEYRKAFAGVEKFDGQELIFIPTSKEEKSYDKIISLATAISENNKYVCQITEILTNAIKKVLVDLDVNTELFDIGSTNRKTNTFENFDLDFSLKLEAKDFFRVIEISHEIENILTFEKEYFYQQNEVYYQLRVKGITAVNGQKLEKPLDLDICFFSRAYLQEYGTHEAISDKLNYIKKYYGLTAYEQALANIILTKQILKTKNAYKRGKNGGFGGGGVETWILANGGNIEEAFSNFQSAAYENGQRLTYKKFREKYKIWDAGVNNRYNRNDNFIEILKPNGYEAILDIIENYFKK